MLEFSVETKMSDFFNFIFLNWSHFLKQKSKDAKIPCTYIDGLCKSSEH